MDGPEITEQLSPNCGPRRGGLTPSLIVIHYTAMISADAALERLCDPMAEVSAHYLITNAGEILRLVPEDQRAWHAGAGQWAGETDINSRSIGIELDNTGAHPFSEPQMLALETLLRQIMNRWSIEPARVIGHSDMAPGRKCDPGPRFDWARLARQRLARPAAAPVAATGEITEDSFRAAACAAGFTAPAPLSDLLSATRLRFAPWRQGALHPDDLNLPPLT